MLTSTLTHVNATLCKASAGNGGAFFSSGTGAGSWSDITLDRNSARQGGALFASGSQSLCIDRASITENTAQTGGAAYFDAFAALSMSDSVVRNNTASSQGAALSLNRAAASDFTRVLFARNSAPSAGGVFCSHADTLSFVSTSFDANTASDGSGGALFADDCAITFANLNCTNNRALQVSQAANGGAFALTAGSSIAGNRCFFQRNAAAGNAGAISATDILDSSMVDCVFDANSAGGSGGAMSLDFDAGMQVTLSDLLVQNNVAGSQAGAIYLPRSFPQLSAYTQRGNTAAFGNNRVSPPVRVLWLASTS